MYHTFDPQYSALYRMHPIPNNQLATQELNQRGLYPTGNQRVDVSGAYPADIHMQRKNNPECNQSTQQCGGRPGCCQAWSGSYDRYGPGRACHACCPGFKATPMSEIVARPSCSSCAAPPVEPRIADGGLGTMSKYEVQRYEAQRGYGCGGCAMGWGQGVSGVAKGPSSCYARDDPKCCTPVSHLVNRPSCSRPRGYKGVPYPYYNYEHNEDVGVTGYAGHYAARRRAPNNVAAPRAPSGRVEPVSPESPLVKAKNGADVGARKEADAVNVARAAQAEAEARTIAAQAADAANAQRTEAGKAAAEGKVGEATEKQAVADKLDTAARQAVQMADQAQVAIIEASKAANNGDSKKVLDAAEAGLKAASGAIEAAALALNGGGGDGSSEVLCGYTW